MSPLPPHTDWSSALPDSDRFVRWLRVVKLLLTILVLALAVWKGLGLGPL